MGIINTRREKDIASWNVEQVLNFGCKFRIFRDLGLYERRCFFCVLSKKMLIFLIKTKKMYLLHSKEKDAYTAQKKKEEVCRAHRIYSHPFLCTLEFDSPTNRKKRSSI
jgi:hypothetical protein